MKYILFIAIFCFTLSCAGEEPVVDASKPETSTTVKDSTYYEVLASLQYFRSLDFYADKQDMSDEELLDLLISCMRNEYEIPPISDSASFDPILSTFFSDMVLGRDKEHIHLIKYDSLKVLPLTEAYDPLLDSTAYTRLFEQLSRISNRHFNPTLISEETDDYGQTTIQFMIDTFSFELKASTPQISAGNGSNIEFDVNILREINRLWSPNKHGFYVHYSQEEEFGVPEMDIPPSTYTHYFFIVFLETAHRDSLNTNKGLHLY